jgi:hypothetical protein
VSGQDQTILNPFVVGTTFRLRRGIFGGPKAMAGQLQNDKPEVQKTTAATSNGRLLPLDCLSGQFRRQWGSAAYSNSVRPTSQ